MGSRVVCVRCCVGNLGFYLFCGLLDGGWLVGCWFVLGGLGCVGWFSATSALRGFGIMRILWLAFRDVPCSWSFCWWLVWVLGRGWRFDGSFVASLVWIVLCLLFRGFLGFVVICALGFGLVDLLCAFRFEFLVLGLY